MPITNYLLFFNQIVTVFISQPISCTKHRKFFHLPHALYWHYFSKLLTTGFWAWNLFIGIHTSALPPLPFLNRFRFHSKWKGPPGKCCELDQFLPGRSPVHAASFPTGRVHTRLSAVRADKARLRIYPAVGPTPGRGWHSKKKKKPLKKQQQKNQLFGSHSNHDTTFSYCSRCILL